MAEGRVECKFGKKDICFEVFFQFMENVNPKMGTKTKESLIRPQNDHR